MAAKEGIEPPTVVLTAPCSASELHRNKWFSVRDSNPRHAVCKTAVLAAELTENGAGLVQAQHDD